MAKIFRFYNKVNNNGNEVLAIDSMSVFQHIRLDLLDATASAAPQPDAKGIWRPVPKRNTYNDISSFKFNMPTNGSILELWKDQERRNTSSWARWTIDDTTAPATMSQIKWDNIEVAQPSIRFAKFSLKNGTGLESNVKHIVYVPGGYAAKVYMHFDNQTVYPWLYQRATDNSWVEAIDWQANGTNYRYLRPQPKNVLDRNLAFEIWHLRSGVLDECLRIEVHFEAGSAAWYRGQMSSVSRNLGLIDFAPSTDIPALTAAIQALATSSGMTGDSIDAFIGAAIQKAVEISSAVAPIFV